jgi:hypothetical protein
MRPAREMFGAGAAHDPDQEGGHEQDDERDGQPGELFPLRLEVDGIAGEPQQDDGKTMPPATCGSPEGRELEEVVAGR